MKNVIIIFAIYLGCCCVSTVFSDDTPTEVVIHATGNSSVPTVDCLVDAVELLKKSFAVYVDDNDRAKLYLELFQEKHNFTEWNVVVGYSAIYFNSKYYVETAVTGGKSKETKKDKDDKNKEKHYLLFSSEPANVTQTKVALF